MSREPSEPEDEMLLEDKNAVNYGAGGAIGTAVLPHPPLSRADVLGVDRAEELRAMSKGFETAFAVAVGIAALGVLLALLFPPQGLIESDTFRAAAAPEAESAGEQCE